MPVSVTRRLRPDVADQHQSKLPRKTSLKARAESPLGARHGRRSRAKGSFPHRLVGEIKDEGQPRSPNPLCAHT
ncbi:MAG: hypothetical protein AUI36_18405 [Cyanobacteria bacterium 13_1_40CM_2_61_4]|nr:MAG: hypothetical protein AUI36_18405 [Cyanobacteria bacterium 13_1_40CM_2_61_4]